MNDRFISVRRRLWIWALCLCVSFWTAALQAQSGAASHFLFPHYISFQGQATAVSVFNPNPSAATVTFTFRDRGGQLLVGVIDPVTRTVPARGQLVVTSDDLFGKGAALDGSLEIQSAAWGLLAQLLASGPSQTYSEAFAAAEASMYLVFPVIPGATEGRAEIDLANPNPRETSVELKLWTMDGKVQGLSTITIPGTGVYRSLVQDAFPAGTNFGNVSHVTAVPKSRNVLSAPQSVAGTCLFMGFFTSASSGFTDLAALNAMPLTAASNAGVIPYFHTGGLYASTLGLVNLESASITATVTAVSNSGSTLGTRTISIAAQGGLRAPLQSVIPDLGSAEREGWLLIQASGRTVGSVIYGRNDVGGIAAVPIQKLPSTGFVFSQASKGAGLNTELSLVNASGASATADIRMVASDGATAAASQITIDPSKRVLTSLKDLMPELAEPWTGLLHVTSNAALFGNVTAWNDRGSAAASLLPQDTAFLDSPLTSFSITGNLTLNNQPAAGFKVALSGAVNKTTASDAGGNYFFTNLPAGSYMLRVTQAGFQFVPAQVNITLTNASQHQNFSAFTAPDAILVQPDSFPVGSPDTAITIFGKDFTPQSTAFVGSLRLATTYVDPTQLHAVVPAFLTAVALRFQITVVTDAADGSHRVSKAYTAVAYQPNPVLQTIETGGSIVEGSPAGNLLLKGTGFLDGAMVRVNGRSDGIQANVVNSQLIVAYLPASYFESGGIFPVTVENPYPIGAASAIKLLTVYYPPPGVIAVIPGVCAVELETDAPPLTVEVMGYGFRLGAVVLLDGQPLVTTYCVTDPYCLDTHMSAKIPATMLKKAGFAKIEVKNPDPALTSSEAAYLRIEGLQPSITSVQSGSPTLSPVPFEFTMPLVVNGTNFGPETFVFIGQTDSDQDASETDSKVLSSTQLLASFKINYPEGLGEWYVYACNPPPGGGCTDPVPFMISEASFAAAPFITSIQPGTVAPGSRSFALTVNGYNFKPGAVINFRTTPLAATFVNGNQLRALVPSSLIRTAGKVPISVTNPDNAGASNRVFLDIK